MPYHVHLLINPLEKLAPLMQTIKGTSAKVINEMMDKSGRFCASNYYDKTIRDEAHFSVVFSYTKNNPLKLPGKEEPFSRFYGVNEE